MYFLKRLFRTKALAEHYTSLAKEKCKQLKEKGISPSMAIILVGDNPASKIYIRHKSAMAEKLGIDAIVHQLPADTALNSLKDTLSQLSNTDVSGILLQLPLPEHLTPYKQDLIDVIPPEKDIDGLTTHNAGLLENGVFTGLKPATPIGIMRILEATHTPLKGKSVTVVGRSNVVGRPLASMLSYADATVITCHQATDDLAFFTRLSDIVISAAGVPGLITSAHIKQGASLIDVGTTRTKEKKLSGDILTKECAKKARFVTPVPGGVGPMTIASLMTNIIDAAYLSHGLKAPDWPAPHSS